MSEVLETVLLLALPASGKSEVRRFLALLDPAEVQRDFHMGETVQLDDFPYVHMMRRIDDELVSLGASRVFFEAPDRSFVDPRDWGTLIELLNEDYEDLVAKRPAPSGSASRHLMERIDAAGQKVGLTARLAGLESAQLEHLASALEPEAAEMAKEKVENYPETLSGKTLVIEFARGGPQGSDFPLKNGFGYNYSLARLSPAILKSSSVLYVWVTPEESRRKNQARTDPNDPGSILHHGVPEYVMLNDYGCDDIDWLIGRGPRDGWIAVERDGQKFELPIARLDNRVDKTSFVREDKAAWATEDEKALYDGLKGALDQLSRLRSA